MSDRFGWTADDRLVTPQCVFCRHKHPTGATCAAFPAGIPDEIQRNVHDHRQPFIGDHGVRFDPEPGQRSPFEEGQ